MKYKSAYQTKLFKRAVGFLIKSQDKIRNVHEFEDRVLLEKENGLFYILDKRRAEALASKVYHKILSKTITGL